MDTLPTRYELDGYGFRVEIVTELESTEECQERQRRAAARTNRAQKLFDVLRVEAGLSPWACIDWRTVEPLPEYEKCVDENPAYLSIPF